MTSRSILLAALATVLVVLGAGAALIAGNPARRAAAALPGFSGRFALSTTDGSGVTDESYRGKWLLLYFGYTFCPDVCPTTLAEMGAALDRLGKLADQVQPLFITVDPARDTPAVLADYVKAFGPRLHALRGTAEETAEAAKAFRVTYIRRDLGAGSYSVDHSSFIYIVDPQGRIVKLVADDGPNHDLAAILRRLLQ
jgi:protein SCO1/2